MRIISAFAPTLVSGNRRERIFATAEIGIRLSLIGYAASTFVPIIDRPLPADLAGMHMVLVTAIIGTIASALIKPV